jgi:hypothetical protein
MIRERSPPLRSRWQFQWRSRRSQLKSFPPHREFLHVDDAHWRRAQVWVRSRTAGGWDESSPSGRSVNSTPSVSSVRQITRHDRRSPMGVRNLNSSGIVWALTPAIFAPAIRDVDQYAGTLQVPAHIVDRSGQMPSEPEVPAPVAPRGSTHWLDIPLPDKPTRRQYTPRVSIA